MELKKVVLTLVAISTVLVSGCSTTTTKKNIQAIGPSGEKDAVIYNEVEVTQRTGILSILTGPSLQTEVKDQRVAFCDKQNGIYDCKSLPIQIDGEAMTVQKQNGILAQ
ncbi:hypothetical protein ACMDCT_12990 [Halomonadaceae bacterium KBTZ08]